VCVLWGVCVLWALCVCVVWGVCVCVCAVCLGMCVGVFVCFVGS